MSDLTALVYQTNPISEADRKHADSIDYSAPATPWDTDGLYITRLRMVSDPGYAWWDITYCHGSLNGRAVRVELPFDRLPRANMRRALFNEAKKSGKFIRGLFDNISTLV